ncbi:Helicase SNF2 [Tsukamurella ocularis]
MGNDEQSSIADEVQAWVDDARGMIDARAQVIVAANRAATSLKQRVVRAGGGDGVRWYVLPIRPDTLESIRSIAAGNALPAIPVEVERELNRLVSEVGQAVADLRKGSGFGRLLLFGGTRDKANQAARFLPEYRAWFLTSGLRSSIDRARPNDDPRVRALGVADALEPWVGLAPILPEQGRNAVVETVESFVELPQAVAVIQGAAGDEAQRRSAALKAGNSVRNAETDRMLAEMSVDRLREASRDRIRVGVLTENGITDVLSVLRNEQRLEQLDGIGATSATRIRGAAQTLRQNTFEEMPIRIDINNRTTLLTTLLSRLRGWDAARRASASPDLLERAVGLAPFAAAVDSHTTHAVVVPSGSSTVAEFDHAVREVIQVANAIADADSTALIGDTWDDFLLRPADYFALLAELGFITEDDEKAQGELPQEIVEAIRGFELKAGHLVASLRGYQNFAARFALVQRKVIIGDEMGLGKTVESIAVLAHLRAKGDNHFVVICPAAVVTNWVREVGTKSKLSAYRLHGSDRSAAAKQWLRVGGVAVTTFETLPWLTENVSVPELGCVVVDEAHYIKNPSTLRSRRVARILDSCERAILLTGTPLENRLDEFRNLVGYLRPDLTVNADEYTPTRFRRQVAPAYLRRNQEDVLTELPELVEVNEWVAMSDSDAAAYRSAVSDRNFMGMRQAAMKQGSKSAKIQRLIELVGEAEANGRRVIVFSHFLNVLNDVHGQLPGRVFGPLTGSVAAGKRQAMVDDFSTADGGAVLVAQIVAGGVGLNIQSASVVVICEPQLKPTTEWQAIARAHRMGQLQSVQVHRLLSDEGVDRRVREILARKKELFESFARESETAASAPEAYDVTEAELARDIIAEERERLFGQGKNAESASRGASPGVDDTSEATRSPDEADESDASARRRAASDLGTRQGPAGGGRPALPLRERGSVSTQMPTRPQVTPRHPPATAVTLARYPVFRRSLPDIATSSAHVIAENVVAIVAAEGPMTGWRIHQLYEELVSSHRSRDELSRLINRAISDVERRGLINSDNPLGQSGNKPLTFRLPTQPMVVARELGPRTIDVVPPNEVAQYCRIVSTGETSLAEEELIERVARLIQISVPSGAMQRAVRAASRIPLKTE